MPLYAQDGGSLASICHHLPHKPEEKKTDQSDLRMLNHQEIASNHPDDHHDSPFSGSDKVFYVNAGGWGCDFCPDTDDTVTV